MNIWEDRHRHNLLNHLVVNEEHKVLYCFIPKVSSSAMCRIFVVMEGLYPSIEKASNVHNRVVRLNNKKFSKEKRLYMLENFYKFVIVRDPLERLVSGYRDKIQNKTHIYNKHQRDLVKKAIERYRYNNTKTVEPGVHDMSFTEYVRYLIDTPTQLVDEHWMSYEHLCRPCNVKYDFIGSIATLQRDVTHIMRQIKANESKYFVTQRSGWSTKAKQATASLLKELPQKYFDQLLVSRKTEFDLFGYPLPDYETLEKHDHA